MQLSLPVYIIVIFAVMYFLMVRPQRKRAKQRRELINNIQSDQRITTTGDTKGTVRTVDETTVIITVNGHDTELTFEKPITKQVDPSQ